MARDYVAEARAVGLTIGGPDAPVWRERLEDVIQGGATGSEILMGLRWVLARILTEAELGAADRDRAGELHRAVDEALS